MHAVSQSCCTLGFGLTAKRSPDDGGNGRRDAQENEPDLEFRGITNSGDVQDAIWLVCLKNIFSKQVGK
jgi:hypothetical protein